DFSGGRRDGRAGRAFRGLRERARERAVEIHARRRHRSRADERSSIHQRASSDGRSPRCNISVHASRTATRHNAGHLSYVRNLAVTIGSARDRRARKGKRWSEELGGFDVLAARTLGTLSLFEGHRLPLAELVKRRLTARLMEEVLAVVRRDEPEPFVVH